MCSYRLGWPPTVNCSKPGTPEDAEPVDVVNARPAAMLNMPGLGSFSVKVNVPSSIVANLATAERCSLVITDFSSRLYLKAVGPSVNPYRTQGDGRSDVGPVAVSYTHLTLPTIYPV